MTSQDSPSDTKQLSLLTAMFNYFLVFPKYHDFKKYSTTSVSMGQKLLQNKMWSNISCLQYFHKSFQVNLGCDYFLIVDIFSGAIYSI